LLEDLQRMQRSMICDRRFVLRSSAILHRIR